MRHRFALSSVFDIPAFRRLHMDSRRSRRTGISRPSIRSNRECRFTISVFGDTANSGTVLGENPIRANVTGQPVFGPGTHTPESGSTLRLSQRPLPLHSATQDEIPCTVRAMQTLDLALAQNFSVTERSAFKFRGEAFNALNKINLGTPNRFVNTPQFGTITMAMTPGREIQVSARLSF